MRFSTLCNTCCNNLPCGGIVCDFIFPSQYWHDASGNQIIPTTTPCYFAPISGSGYLDFDDYGLRFTENNTVYTNNRFISSSGVNLWILPGGLYDTDLPQFNNARGYISNSAYVQYNYASNTLSVHGMTPPNWSPLLFDENIVASLSQGSFLPFGATITKPHLARAGIRICHKVNSGYATIGPISNGVTTVQALNHFPSVYLDWTSGSPYFSVPFSSDTASIVGIGGDSLTLIGASVASYSHNMVSGVVCGNCDKMCNMCDDGDLPNTATVTVDGSGPFRCGDHGPSWTFDGAYELERVSLCGYHGIFEIPGYPVEECQIKNNHMSVYVKHHGNGIFTIGVTNIFGGEMYVSGCTGGSKTEGGTTYTLSL